MRNAITRSALIHNHIHETLRRVLAHLPAAGCCSEVGELWPRQRLYTFHLAAYTHSGLDSVVDVLEEELLVGGALDRVAIA